MSRLTEMDCQKMIVRRAVSNANFGIEPCEVLNPEVYIEQRVDRTVQMEGVLWKMKYKTLKKVWKILKFEERKVIVFRGLVNLRIKNMEGEEKVLLEVLTLEQIKGEIRIKRKSLGVNLEVKMLEGIVQELDLVM